MGFDVKHARLVRLNQQLLQIRVFCHYTKTVNSNLIKAFTPFSILYAEVDV